MAIPAARDIPAERRGAAGLDRTHHLHEVSEDVRDFQSGTLHESVRLLRAGVTFSGTSSTPWRARAPMIFSHTSWLTWPCRFLGATWTRPLISIRLIVRAQIEWTRNAAENLERHGGVDRGRLQLGTASSKTAGRGRLALGSIQRAPAPWASLMSAGRFLRSSTSSQAARRPGLA
jgi:hypothetical protein